MYQKVVHGPTFDDCKYEMLSLMGLILPIQLIQPYPIQILIDVAAILVLTTPLFDLAAMLCLSQTTRISICSQNLGT